MFPVIPAAQLLPTALAATAEAPHIRNNGAAAHQHQWAQGGPWLYAFARLFYSFHMNRMKLPLSQIYDRNTENESLKKSLLEKNISSVTKHFKCNDSDFFFHTG